MSTNSMSEPQQVTHSLDLRVDGQRLWESLMTLAQIGATPKGGSCRLALTEEDRAGRELVTGWLQAAGLTLRVDQIGNIFARRAGRNNDLPPVATGSHIDTQPTGGKFDGCYGVLAGLEVMRVLDEQGIETEAPLEVVIWTNEEGSRFVPVMMGSGVHAGLITLEEALAATDRDGDTVAASLERTGYAGQEPLVGMTLAPILKLISSRGRYWNRKLRPSVRLPAPSVCTGSTLSSVARKPTRVRHLWPIAATLSRRPAHWSARS